MPFHLCGHRNFRLVDCLQVGSHLRIGLTKLHRYNALSRCRNELRRIQAMHTQIIEVQPKSRHSSRCKHDGIKTLTVYVGAKSKIWFHMRDVSNWVDDC